LTSSVTACAKMAALGGKETLLEGTDGPEGLLARKEKSTLLESLAGPKGRSTTVGDHLRNQKTPFPSKGKSAQHNGGKKGVSKGDGNRREEVTRKSQVPNIRNFKDHLRPRNHGCLGFKSVHIMKESRWAEAKSTIN